MENKDFKAIFSGLTLIGICNIIGHYLSPFSLFLSYLYMNFIIIYINKPLFNKNYNMTVIYSYALLLVNDILIRLYVGGTHNNAGKGWCLIMYLLSTLIATIVMLSSITKINNENRYKKISVLAISLTISLLIYWNFNAPL